MGRDIMLHNHTEGKECTGKCEDPPHSIVRHYTICRHRCATTIKGLKLMIKEITHEIQECDCDCEWGCIQYWMNILMEAPDITKDDNWVEIS